MIPEIPIEEFTPEQLLGPLNELERKQAPKKLFVRGSAKLLQIYPRVSIVGSRKASAAGLGRAKRLAGIVAEAGGVVVSGLALGVDAAAHWGAIAAGGKTVAVIGTPLDKSYPKENAELQQ